jgi:hypothetical protein
MSQFTALYRCDGTTYNNNNSGRVYNTDFREIRLLPGDVCAGTPNAHALYTSGHTINTSLFVALDLSGAQHRDSYFDCRSTALVLPRIRSTVAEPNSLSYLVT